MASRIGSLKKYWLGMLTCGMLCYSASGQTGVWTKCQVPITIDINYPNGGGAQTVLVDPVRPSDIYAFVSPSNDSKTCVLKSTDFGVSWTDMNQTTTMHGNPWGAGIDPNPHRDPNTPPTMYAPAGFGTNGIWKSVDGGVTWTHLLQGSTPFDPYNPYGAVDVYQIAVLPDNTPNHVLFTYHYNWKNMSEGGFGESTDGGATWAVHMPPAGIGMSQYLMIVDKNTWLSIAQGNNGANGIWKTSTAGRVNGAIATAAWKKVDNFEHQHGSFGSYTDPSNGYIYAAGEGGIKRTTNAGESWSWVYQANGYNTSSVAGTPNFLYASQLFAATQLRASRKNEASWAPYPSPSDMKSGSTPFGTVTTYNGTNWIIIMGCDSDGLWRYVEPSVTTGLSPVSRATKSTSATPKLKVVAKRGGANIYVNGVNGLYDVTGRNIKTK